LNLPLQHRVFRFDDTPVQWTDLDLARGTVSVRRTLARVNGRWLFEEPKTKSSRRTVPLLLGLTAELSEHMSHQLELGFTDLVFCNRDGGPSYERGIVHSAFKPALTAAGLPAEVRLYDLRHTHATLLLMAGVHPKVVAERLGHSNIRALTYLTHQKRVQLQIVLGFVIY
jgi:integrase